MLCLSCRSEHDGIDDEYARGFFNAMAIIEKRGFINDKENQWPYWGECKRSYLNKQDLYNYWDSSYLIKQKP